MKPLSLLAIAMVALLLVVPNNAEAQKRTSTKTKAREPVGAGCAVTVRDDLVPNRKVVVVGCDMFGIGEIETADGKRRCCRPTNGGIVVLDDELHVIFKWDACSACGGFFNHFAGTKKIGRHNALLVQLISGPRLDSGRRNDPIGQLFFNGKEFEFAPIPR